MKDKLKNIKGCVILPTYNNGKTLKRVIDGILEIIDKDDLFIVNDGCTDNTPQIIATYNFNESQLIHNNPNKGKGTALKKAFKQTYEQGYLYAITIDSDGQHYPSEIPKFIAALQSSSEKNCVVMGSRNMETEGVPTKSSFGNKFSNFWFRIETTWKLPDTQTGYRLYPLEPISKLRLYSSKFETEIEVIVKLAWDGVEFIPIPIEVLYDPEERVTHFRPFKDFTRISILNTYLCIIGFLYYLPRMGFLSLKKKGIKHHIRTHLINPEESNQKKALSIGFGFFMGIIPLWGFQLLIGIPLSIFFKMNKFLFITAANISIPPMIPIIIFVSYWFGSFFVDQGFQIEQVFDLSLASIYANMKQYIIGSILFASCSFVVGYFTSLILLNKFYK